MKALKPCAACFQPCTVAVCTRSAALRIRQATLGLPAVETAERHGVTRRILLRTPCSRSSARTEPAARASSRAASGSRRPLWSSPSGSWPGSCPWTSTLQDTADEGCSLFKRNTQLRIIHQHVLMAAHKPSKGAGKLAGRTWGSLGLRPNNPRRARCPAKLQHSIILARRNEALRPDDHICWWVLSLSWEFRRAGLRAHLPWSGMCP